MKKPMKKFKRYEGGGTVMGEVDPKEAAAKEAGLKASKGEDVGFFKRMRMGNIDQPGTEAYNRFGAGRGRDRGELVSVNQPMPTAAPAAPSMPAASSRPLSDDMYSDFGPSAGRSSSETITPTRPMATQSVAPAKPAGKPINTPPALKSALKSRPMSAADDAAFQDANISPITRATYDYGTRKMSRESKYPGSDPKEGGARGEGGYGSSNVGNQNSLASTIPGQSVKAPKGDKIDSSETERNINAALTATGLGGAAAGAYKLKKMYDASKAAKKASSSTKGVERPGKDFLDGLTTRDMTAKKASPSNKKLEKFGRGKDFIDGLSTRDMTAKKRGGAVKKYASGGMVSSASKRADGIATKGKTRGKMC